ncbi:MAG: MT-A70 family methyltransferase [Candidatus Rokubacteria bacterium]|nr:MT-A70 family methyltransferase [Candidatus Rokubacteria bacterium]
MKLPPGPFDVILADPPWSYFQTKPPTGNLIGCVVNKYTTMSLAELEALPVADLCSPGGTLLAMWATLPKLIRGDAARLIRAWGFTPKAGIIWVKTCHDGVTPRAGIGYWSRGVGEVVALATRGPIRVPPRGPACQPGIVSDEGGWLPVTPGRNDKPGWIVHAPRGRHSEKPPEVHAFLETMTAHHGARRLELFARQTRPGWTCWGNEVDDDPLA